jgi:uncharacterized iron-regulated membrane protein
MLSVTGVYIWWKKRRGRMIAAARKRLLSGNQPVVAGNAAD